MELWCKEGSHIKYKNPGPTTSMMLRHWLGAASEQCDLSSNTAVGLEDAAGLHQPLEFLIEGSFLKKDLRRQCKTINLVVV